MPVGLKRSGRARRRASPRLLERVAEIAAEILGLLLKDPMYSLLYACYYHFLRESPLYARIVACGEVEPTLGTLIARLTVEEARARLGVDIKDLMVTFYEAVGGSNRIASASLLIRIPYVEDGVEHVVLGEDAIRTINALECAFERINEGYYRYSYPWGLSGFPDQVVNRLVDTAYDAYLAAKLIRSVGGGYAEAAKAMVETVVEALRRDPLKIATPEGPIVLEPVPPEEINRRLGLQALQGARPARLAADTDGVTPDMLAVALPVMASTPWGSAPGVVHYRAFVGEDGFVSLEVDSALCCAVWLPEIRVERRVDLS